MTADRGLWRRWQVLATVGASGALWTAAGALATFAWSAMTTLHLIGGI